MKNKHWLLLGVLILVTSCDNIDLSGSWVQPIPGNENQVQGIILNDNGSASSINMATLQYDTWKKEGDKLILAGKSIGNHQTISFIDTLTIFVLKADTLVIGSPEWKQVYSRLKE